MASAANLVRRFRQAGDGAPGVGTGKAPRSLLMVLKRVFPGIPEYNVLIGTESPHLFSYKSDTRFSVNMTDLKMLLRNGLMRMQVNNPGHITLYFGPTGDEEATNSGAPDFVQMGRDAFARGANSSAGRAEITSLAQKNPSINVLKALTDWARGWHEANVAAPVE